MGNFQRPFPLKVPYFSYRAAILQLPLPPQGSLNWLQCMLADSLAKSLEQQCVQPFISYSSKGIHELAELLDCCSTIGPPGRPVLRSCH